MQPDVCSPLDTGRTTTAIVLYHQHESLPKSVLNSLNSLVQQKLGAERCNRSAPKRKAEYALHLLPTYTHAGVVNSVLLKCRKLRREDQETSDSIVGFFIEKPQCDGRLQSSKILS